MDRYSRQITLPNINQRGQDQLLASSVLIVGVGGLGCPVAQYLAGAGIGKIGLLDGDKIGLSNLHRQVLYKEKDCGQQKASTARNYLSQLNTEIDIQAFDAFLTYETGLELFRNYDIIVDCTDNIPARLLINDLCCELNKTWVYGGVRQFEGQVTVFNHDNGPSYRCLFPNHSPNQASCEDEGVLGVTPGIVGTYMSSEVLKLLLGIGEPLSGKIMVLNLLTNETNYFNVKKNPTNFTNNPTVIQSIAPSQLEEILQDHNITLLDVRESHELEICKIEGAIHIPLSELSQSYKKLPKKARIVAYCHHGMRSLEALQYLSSQGYTNLTNLSGGIDKWSVDVDKTLKRY